MYAQFQQKDQRDLARYQHALETLLTAEIEAKALIGDLKSMLELLPRENNCESPREPCLVSRAGVGVRAISSWSICGDICVVLEIPGTL